MYEGNVFKRRLRLLLHPKLLFQKMRRYSRILHFPEAIVKFKHDKKLYSRLNKRKEFDIDPKHMYPVLYEYLGDAGCMGGYFYQDLWAARKIFKDNPAVHYDIGSSVGGFILALLSFRNVVLIDIRPLTKSVDGLSFTQADATNLDGIPDNSIMSLSALCSLEHFGLGRYGDPVDPEACFKAFDAIQRVCAPGAKVYISVPVGPNDCVEFNAHRIFNPDTVIGAFSKMTLKEFVFYDGNDEGTLKTPTESGAISRNAMGFFEFMKI